MATEFGEVFIKKPMGGQGFSLAQASQKSLPWTCRRGALRN